jgi:MFS family permease
VQPGGTAGAAVWDAAHRGLTIGLLLVISITAFEALAVATVLPATAADLGGDASLGWYGWVFSGFMLANLVGIPAAGRLADRGGATWPFIVGSVLFAAGLLVAGLTSSMPVLVAGRIAQGFGAGALSSVAYVAVARGYASADQPRMLALLASAWVVPGLIGPVAAAAVAHQFGWRAVYLLLVPMTGIAAALAVSGLRGLESSSPGGSSESSSMSMRDAVQLALGAGIAQLGAETHQLFPTLVCAAGGFAVGFPALRRLLPAGTLLAAPGAPAALAAKGLVTFAFFGAEAFLPLALTTVRGETMVVAGAALTAGTLAWTTGAWIQERLISRIDPVVLVRTGLATVAVAIVGAAGVLFVPGPGVVAIVVWALAGLGIGVSYSTTTLIVFDLTPKGEEGGAAAALQLANVLGVAFGTGAGGAMLAIATSTGASEASGIAAIDAVMVAVAIVGAMAAGRARSARSGTVTWDSHLGQSHKVTVPGDCPK